MKLGRLLGGLSAASVVTLASIPVASAAPAAPAAYAAVARAYPLNWDGYSGIAVNDDLRVPYVSGLSNHAPVARAEAALALPDLSVKTMTGESIQGLACQGYEAKRCRDPFLPEAVAGHASAEPTAARQFASFLGRAGQNPGQIDALLGCGGDCGEQLVRTTAEALAPAGAIPGMISIGSSSAKQDVNLDDSGRVVGSAVSELRNVAIGPEREVTFSRLTSTARAVGTGLENSKEGQGAVSVSDLVILGNPVELTGAGLRLAHGAVSEQEAYDGAKALLAKLRDERGIGLEFGKVTGEVLQEAAQVTVQVAALRVRFDPVKTPRGVAAERIEEILDLGSSTMVLMAFDRERRIDVSYEGDDVVVQAEPEAAPTTTPAAAPAPPESPTAAPSSTATSGAAKVNPGPASSPSSSAKFQLPSNAAVKVKVQPARPASKPAAPTTPVPTPVPATPLPETPADSTPAPVPEAVPSPAVEPSLDGVDEEAFGLRDISRSLEDARAVSRAFGVFLALGLVLPLARFVIKRFG